MTIELPTRKQMNRPEESLQRSVCAYLDRALPPRALWWHAHQNPRSQRDGGRLKGLGLRAGMPDLMILLDGKLYGLELKAPKGRITPAQEAVADKFNENGAYWTVARSVEAVEAFLAHLGVPLRCRVRPVLEGVE